METKKKMKAEDAEILLNKNNSPSEFVDAVLELNEEMNKERRAERGANSEVDMAPSKVSSFTLRVDLPKAYQKKLHQLRDLHSLNYSHLVMNMIDKTFEENRKEIDDFYAM